LARTQRTYGAFKAPLGPATIATSLASVEVRPPEADRLMRCEPGVQCRSRDDGAGRVGHPLDGRTGACPSRRAEATLLVSPTGKGYLTVLGSSWDDFVFWLRGIFS